MNKSLIISILIGIFFFCKFELFSQQTFNLTFNEEAGFQINEMIEDNDYILFTAVHLDLSNPGDTRDTAIVIKWNPETGDSTAIKILPEGYKQLNLNNIRKKVDGGYIIFGGLNTYLIPTDSLNALYVAGLDSNLNIEWEVIHEIENEICVSFRNCIQLENSNWIGSFISEYYYPTNTTYISHNSMFEITEMGNILRMQWVDSIGRTDKILFDSKSGGYYLFGGYLEEHGKEHIVQIDSNFNFVRRKYVNPPQYWDSPYDFLQLSSDTLLLTGQKRWGGVQDIGFFKAAIKDSTIEMLEDYSYFYPNSVDGAIKNKGISKTPNGKYYIVGCLDVSGYMKGWVGCYDNNLNRISEKIFAKPQYRVGCGPATATSDEGILLVVGYWDNPSGGENGFNIMKLDSTLQVEWVKPINATFYQEDWLVSPNPAKDWLEVVSVMQYRFEKNNYSIAISDMQGRQVLQQAVTVRKTKLNIEGLANGTYILVVSNRQYPVFSTKIIKN